MCWGGNYRGQLGYGDTDDRGDQPNEMGSNLQLVDLGSGFVVKDVHSGTYQRCALSFDFGVKCWGRATYGALGNSNVLKHIGDEPGEMGSNLPSIAFGVGFNVLSISSGDGQRSHHCVLSDNASLLCWGLNQFGELGMGNTDNAKTPEMSSVQFAFTTPAPTTTATTKPTTHPSANPSTKPTVEPSDKPSAMPTVDPTHHPSVEPTTTSTDQPTYEPTAAPTRTPTIVPSEAATVTKGALASESTGQTTTSVAAPEDMDISAPGASGSNTALIAVFVAGAVCLLAVCVALVKWSCSKRQVTAQTEANIAKTIDMHKDIEHVPGTSVSTPPPESPEPDAGPALQMEGVAVYSNKMAEGAVAVEDTAGNGGVYSEETPPAAVDDESADATYSNVTTGQATAGKATQINAREAVLEWLRRDTIRMEQYLTNFWEYGYESLELIKAIESKAELAEIGIHKVGHQVFLLKHIRKL